MAADPANEPAYINGNHIYNGRPYPNVTLDSSVDALQSFTVRPDDTWVCAAMKSGTHWMSEIVHLVHARGDLDKVDRTISSSCIEMIDIPDVFLPNRAEELANPVDMSPFMAIIERAPSTAPRVITTHIHLEALPPTLLDIGKVIYIVRNPKDVLNSMWNFRGKKAPFGVAWEDLLDKFITGRVVGDWKNLFTVAQNERFDRWYHDTMDPLDIPIQFN